ncbi:MAG: hypothetical protein NTY37_09455 [Methanothrix sp.]|nr:hypothetical protein [Methanothrix sp.]
MGSVPARRPQARGREPVAGGLAWVLAEQARLAWFVLENLCHTHPWAQIFIRY